MKTKLLLAGMVLPAIFAACTAEEIVSQQEMTQVDLGNRPVVGNVVLDFGGVESRGTVDPDGLFNTIKFTEGEDGFGARLIDDYTPVTSYAQLVDHPWRNYTPNVNNYAHTNYKYVWSGNGWDTEALLVEGNYMFYYPYNKNHLARTATRVSMPMIQTVSKECYNQPIKDLYEGESPAIVGYTFLRADNQTNRVSPTLQHIFAYPQFTFVNKYKETTTGYWGQTVLTPKAITIEKVVVRYMGENYFAKNGVINNKNFEKELRDFSLSEVKYNGATVFDAKSKGEWAAGRPSLLTKAATEDIVDWTTTGVNPKGNIEIEFEGLTLQPEEMFSFNMVLPAGVYYDEYLTFEVILADGKKFEVAKTVDANIYDKLNFAPGLRYPSEEYNNLTTNPTAKPSAGKLATITFTEADEIIDYTQPAAQINDAAEFEAYLNTVADNAAMIEEVDELSDITNPWQFVLADSNKDGVADLQINQAVVDLVKKYLAQGSVKFMRSLNVVADADETIALDQMTFNNVEILSGNVTVADVTANSVTVWDGTLTVPATYAGQKLGNITLKGGELILNKEDFMTRGGANKIVIDHVLNNAGVEISAGELTINEDQDLRGTSYVDNFVMKAGKMTIAAEKTVKFGTISNTEILGGKVVNNGTIELLAAYTIQSGVEFENHGTVSGSLSNEGDITTSKSLVVVANNGTITPSSAKITLTVNGGNGTVNNTELAKVTGTNSNTIYAEVPSIAFMEQANFKHGAGINKIVVTGALDVETVSFKLQDKITVVEFKGGSLYVAGDLKFNFNDAAVVINADTEWTGRNDVWSNHMLNIKSISVNADEDGETYSFTYNGITVNTTSLTGLSDNL